MLSIYFNRIPKSVAKDYTNYDDIANNALKCYYEACCAAIDKAPCSNTPYITINSISINVAKLQLWLEECINSGCDREKAIKEFADENVLIYDEEEVMQFNQVNFIFKFFERLGKIEYDKVFDSLVTMDDLNLLKYSCIEVLNVKNEEVSKVLLPNRIGFFFGSTDYNEEYYNNIQFVLNSIETLRKVIENGDSLSVTFSY